MGAIAILVHERYSIPNNQQHKKNKNSELLPLYEGIPSVPKAFQCHGVITKWFQTSHNSPASNDIVGSVWCCPYSVLIKQAFGGTLLSSAVMNTLRKRRKMIIMVAIVLQWPESGCQRGLPTSSLELVIDVSHDSSWIPCYIIIFITVLRLHNFPFYENKTSMQHGYFFMSHSEQLFCVRFEMSSFPCAFFSDEI